MLMIPPEIRRMVKQRPDGRWQCPFCGRHYKNRHDVYSHIRTHHTAELLKYQDPRQLQLLVQKAPSAQPPEPRDERASNGIEVLPINEQEYFIREMPERYIPQGEELALLQAHMESGIPLLFVGPKGTGKTLAVAWFAYANKIPIIQFDCSENTKRFDLIGRFVLIGNEVKYLLGALPTAIVVANRCGKAILVLEEINALTPAQQKVLNQLLDWRRHVYIPELGKTYELKEGAKLLVVGTMNPSSYGGTYELNEDLRSRFCEYRFDYPQRKLEREIIKVNVGEVDERVIEGILTLAAETRAGEKRGELPYAMSTRDVVNCLRAYKHYLKVFNNKKKALKLALLVTVVNRYDDSTHRKTVIERIRSIFKGVW